MDRKQSYGTIFDIQRMSLHDGPGIRTTVFFKGCAMRCFWCHNPESLSPGADMQYFAARCIRCGLCREVCAQGCHQLDAAANTHSYLRADCIKCGKCADICPSGSLVKTGYEISPEELTGRLLRDKPFFDHSGGGVTASGGEPLLQAAFVSRLFQMLKKEGVHTAVETALYVPSASLQEVIPDTDFFLADLKHPDPLVHEAVTGVRNEQILRNILLLDQSNVPYCVRIPVIPGVNDTAEVMGAFQTFLKKLENPLYLELMPYHTYGVGKYGSLSKDHARLDALHPPAKEHLIRLAKCFDTLKVLFRDGAKEITILGGVLCEENQE